MGPLPLYFAGLSLGAELKVQQLDHKLEFIGEAQMSGFSLVLCATMLATHFVLLKPHTNFTLSTVMVTNILSFSIILPFKEIMQMES